MDILLACLKVTKAQGTDFLSAFCCSSRIRRRSSFILAGQNCKANLYSAPCCGLGSQGAHLIFGRLHCNKVLSHTWLFSRASCWLCFDIPGLRVLGLCEW